jgi:hypothetical protein
MDKLKRAFPFVPQEDLESALKYAEGEVDLAMAMVGSAVDFTITPRTIIAIFDGADFGRMGED